jgi:dephospho-CoA kinase
LSITTNVFPPLSSPSIKKLYYYLTGHWAIVLDIPLLFEGPLHLFCGTVLVVAVTSPSLQTSRLLARDPHLSAADAANRVASQGDVREKAKRALHRGPGRGVVVWNDAGKDELGREIERVMVDVRKRSPGWWSFLCLAFPPVGIVGGLWAVWRNWILERAWGSRDGGKAKL